MILWGKGLTMKFFLALFLFVIFIFIGYQAYSLYIEKGELHARLEEVAKERVSFEEQNKKAMEDILYYEEDHNAAKESVSQFNYKRPDEELYILIPGQ